uniref:AB hydrolase-1 domain-containing protein n=1 Tax=Tetradesmus obliquus TaxID=3088 RepID=A0A383VNF0_TETOB|eukprot:jgi/Sobl393_1/16573/SZX66443.1
MLPDTRAFAGEATTARGSPSLPGSPTTANNPNSQEHDYIAGISGAVRPIDGQTDGLSIPAGSTGSSRSSSSSSSGSSTEGGVLRQQLGLSGDLRSYLEQVFKNAPDALLKIGQAGQQEDQLGWFGTTTSDAEQQQQQQVQAMDGYPGSSSAANRSATDDPEVLNAQYEATLPQYKSRIYDQVAARGYPLERHAAVTTDGYELVLHRIPHGKDRNNQPGVKKPVVFLQHGVTLASDCFTVFGANESLAYILADAGYDVWMGNTRGNTYSRRTTKGLFPYQAEFWYFSMDKMALHDVPAMVDYALQHTGAIQLAYVGHSQGATLGLMLCASRPEYCQKMSVMVLMGPVVFVDYMQSSFLKVFTNEINQPWRVSGEFLPNRLVGPVYQSLCSHWPMDEVCVAAISFVSFGPSMHVGAAEYLTLSGSWPSSAGSRNLVHWGQGSARYPWGH